MITDDAEASDDEADGELECSCEACTLCREYELEREERRRHYVPRGIARWAHEALGPGWLDDGERGRNVDRFSTQELAQRALAETFEQVERVARTGRERCLGGELYSTAPLDPAKSIKRQEAVDLIRMLGDSLDYARVHLDFLDGPRVFALGSHVADAHERNEPATGVVEGILSENRVRVRWDGTSVSEIVRESELRILDVEVAP